MIRRLFTIPLLFLTLVTLGLGPTLFLPPPVRAQDAYGMALARMINSQSASSVYTDDTDVALIVKYIGTDTLGGTVAVAAGGDITFSTGAIGSSSVSTALECPVSGALGGIIDVSDAACNTLGEVVDIINASTDWRAWIVDGQRSDSSNDTLNALSEATANGTDGTKLYRDTSAAFATTMALIPPEMKTIKTVLKRPQVGNKLIPNPFVGNRAVLFKSEVTSTYGSGTSAVSLVCVVPTLSTPGGTAGSEVATTMYSTAGGATTVALTSDWSPYGFFGCKDGKLLLKLVNSAAAGTVTMSAYANYVNTGP